MALSPMMQQYMQTKEHYKDAILFYRLGDFYEMFFEDAITASKVLDITLTGRDCGLAERAPMCGIPFHAADGYLSRLIEAGYKVAICDQVSEPKKGVKLVEREVVRVVTPGTLIESTLLDDKSNNYIACCFKDKNGIGVSFVDISTGIFNMVEYREDELSSLNNLFVQIRPREVICNNDMFLICSELPCHKLQLVTNFALYQNEYDYDTAIKVLNAQFGTKYIMGLKISDKQSALISAGALVTYLLETQKRSLQHINECVYLVDENFMQIDANTRKNLEMIETVRDRKRKGSLLWLLDKTQTSMGARTLKTFIEQPLYNEKLINYRLNGVEELIKNIITRDALKEELNKVYDIERLCGRISYANVSPKDFVALKNSLAALPNIKKIIEPLKTTIIKDIYNCIYDYSSITNLLDSAIVDNPPYNTREGGFIKPGYNKELDDLMNISTVGKTWVAALEAQERESTGIKTLKIGFNNVFGYYIEVSKLQSDLVPYRYQRKQTVANAERYITDELKQMEEKILNAEDQRIKLEQMLFVSLREQLMENISAMQKTARQIAMLDAILSLALVAAERNYCKPTVSKNINTIEIINGRHPIVEALIKAEVFVPNDTFLDNNENRTMIITGPNMAGKSTYMRQVALITLMAHIGSYVPASTAKISLTDKIFTRVGASDDLAFGQSTFMVEMTEVSNILKGATNNSLIILDEVGRGTSTFDGLSIAWSIMEYLSKTIHAKTLFATHYHELTDLEGMLEGVKNYRINVKEFNNSVIFLRKIVRGGANKSFGIEVAELAGVPAQIITRAREILHTLEQNEVNNNETLLKLSSEPQKMETRNKQAQEIISVLNDLKLETLTPLNAFDILANLKEKLKK